MKEDDASKMREGITELEKINVIMMTREGKRKLSWEREEAICCTRYNSNNIDDNDNSNKKKYNTQLQQ